MFNDDIKDIQKNRLIAAVVSILSIPILVVIYLIAIILTTERTVLLKEKYEYVVEILKTAGLFIGGIAVFINIFFAAKRAYAMEESAKAANESAIAANKNAEIALENTKIALKNLKISEDKQITERFAKAIEQLASEKIEVRLGAIYTLERIAKDSEKDQWTIMEVLTAFVRENAPIKKEDKPQNKKSLVDEWLNVQKEKEIEELPKLRLDIQECLTVIGRREHPDPENKKLDLSNVNIAQANLQGANFQKANLQKANLQKANLAAVHLEEANLTETNFQQANLTGAFLTFATLFKAFFKRANLQRATLAGANLKSANLQNTNLEGANIGFAFLLRANLEGANLKGAKIQNTNLEGANLKGAIMPDGSVHD